MLSKLKEKIKYMICIKNHDTVAGGSAFICYHSSNSPLAHSERTGFGIGGGTNTLLFFNRHLSDYNMTDHVFLYFVFFTKQKMELLMHQISLRRLGLDRRANRKSKQTETANFRHYNVRLPNF